MLPHLRTLLLTHPHPRSRKTNKQTWLRTLTHTMDWRKRHKQTNTPEVSTQIQPRDWRNKQTNDRSNHAEQSIPCLGSNVLCPKLKYFDSRSLSLQFPQIDTLLFANSPISSNHIFSSLPELLNES